MSNKLNSKVRKRRERTEANIIHTEVIRKVIEYLLTVAMVGVCVVVPLYARDGYHQIGNAKFEAYRSIMIVSFSVLSVLTAVLFVCRFLTYKRGHGSDQQLTKNRWSLSGTEYVRKSENMPVHRPLSVTDIFVLAYLVLTGISVISGGFYEDALWGSFGWNMGFASQLSFVMLYLFLSRFGKYWRVILAALGMAAAVVFCIGILHRLMIDPIGFYNGLTDVQKAQFLSTLGQATWYASFLILLLPAGMGVFLYTESGIRRSISGVYMLIGFCTLVTQNSDSAYFALVGMFIVFFVVSCEKRETMCRFMAAVTIFFAAGKVMGLLMRIKSNPELEPDPVTELMWNSGLTWGLLVICLLVTLALYKFRQYPVSIMCRIRWGVTGIMVGLVFAAVAVICLQNREMLPGSVADKVAEISYLNWNDEWGNGRGRIWEFACKVISEESLPHRVFGVGPDCFNSYVTAYHGEETELLWGDKQLTNVHNEWLNILINGGILGAMAYLGIFVSAVYRFLRGRTKTFLLTGIAAAVVAYMCYNFFCYQQVLCTPFVFILMGTGEYILREQNRSSTA